MVYLKPKINKRYAWNKAVMVYPWPKINKRNVTLIRYSRVAQYKAMAQ